MPAIAAPSAASAIQAVVTPVAHVAVVHAAATSPIVLPLGTTTLVIQNLSTPPHWTAYVSAITTPVVALVAAGIASYIGWRQWKTAHSKLNLDLFAKRSIVYEGVRKLIIQCVVGSKIDDAHLNDYVEATRGSRWLFDEAFAHYLKEAVYDRAVDMQTDAAELEPHSQLSDQDKKELRERIRGTKAMLREELKLLDDRVKKWMKIVQ